MWDTPRVSKGLWRRGGWSGLLVSEEAMALVEQIVPPARLTEGLTWRVTGLSIGVAIGAAGSGWMVDAFGASSGFGWRLLRERWCSALRYRVIAT